MSGYQNTEPTGNYATYQNGSYTPLYYQTPSGQATAPNYSSSTAYTGGSNGGAPVNPQSTQFFTQNAAGGYDPYSGSVYSGNGSGGYALFSDGAATTPTTPATQTTPTPTPTTDTNPNTATGGAGATVAGSPTANTTNAPGMSNAGVTQGTDLLANQMQEITNQNISQLNNPTVPASAQATPVNQQVQPGENLTSDPVDEGADQVNSGDANIAASTVGNTATAATPNPIQAAQVAPITIDPSLLANATTAVTASLPPDALVSNQLQELLTPDANGNLPSWVQPAVTAANQFLTGRGISNSTMAGQAITSAILTAAIPIATSNASAVLTAWQQNLTNEQQAAMQNGQAVIQGMFNNQAAANAAAQFNATSVNQTNQFMGSLAAQVNQFNAAQVNAISQFNATQSQSAATASAQLKSQLDQFNANMANQREQFNVQNAIIVQQSNAEYLRSVNTANTAVANQDNQLNATNAMNLSDQAMANLQQQFNDEATMLYNSGMTQEEQNFAMAYLSQQFGLQNQLDENITDAQEGQALNQQIGAFAGSLLNPIAGSIGTGLGSLVSGLFGSGSGTDVNVNGNSNGGTNPLDPGGNTGTTVGQETNPLDPESGDTGDI